MRKQLLAQDQSLAPQNIEFTKSIIDKYGFTADVTFHTDGTSQLIYKYEKSPEMERLTVANQIFVRQIGKSWGKSNDQGKSVGPADSETQLNTYALIANSAFDRPVNHDKKQGETVWKFTRKEDGKNFHLFTYERTREHPTPNGFYPRFTFIKYPDDEDGKLLLVSSEANLRDDAGKLFPVEMHFQYKNDPSVVRSQYETWITGEVFTQDNLLLFRTDKPVQGDNLGNIVQLGVSRQAAKVLLPMYMKAAENHSKVRLYGILLPNSPTSIENAASVPNVQFMTWKIHAPSDPDELPDDQRIIIHPQDSVPGYDVKFKHCAP